MPEKIEVGRRCEWAPDDGSLRAIADNEVADGWRPDLEAHVRTCEECRDRSQSLRATASLARGRLMTLLPPSAMTIGSPPFESLLVAKPARWGLPNAMEWRTPWMARVGAIAAAVALAASWPAVSTFADSAMQSFRVQRVQPITIDQAALRGRFEGLSVDESKMREALRYRGPDSPTITITSQADAAARSGLALRLPKSVPATVGSKPPRFVVTSGGVADIAVDGPKLVQVAKDAKVTDGALLTRIGALDGATFKVEGSPAVVAVWGDVDIPTQVPSGKAPAKSSAPIARGPVMLLGQMKSPVVNVSSSVDIDGLRDALLKSGSVPPEVVQALSAVRDWKTTLPLPADSASGLRQIDLDGTKATVSTRTQDGKATTTMVWVRDGVIYGAGGDLSEAELVASVRSLAPAKP